MNICTLCLLGTKRMTDALLVKREEALLLFDEYKSLLTASQRSIFSDYYLDDLSLSEIAENHQISKAAASDSLHKSLAKLKEYEDCLHEVEFKQKISKALEKRDFALIEEALENGI